MLIERTASIMASMLAPDDSAGSVIQQLIEGRNREENFRRVFEKYFRAVSRFFFRKGFSTEDSCDLTQEVFVAVFRGIKNLRSEAAFVPWLFSIAHHVALRQWEQERTRPSMQAAAAEADGGDDGSDALELAAEPNLDPEGQMLDLERVQVVRRALQQLPERMQYCLKARLLEGLGNKEISIRLGISESTVAVHVHRGIEALKNHLLHYFSKVPFAGDF